jgi:lipopolysaccharide/colanic/teichoic acid biosynthesis glycosyltransferase
MFRSDASDLPRRATLPAKFAVADGSVLSSTKPWRASRVERATKRALDVALAAILLVLLSPLLLAIAISVALSSGLPVIYRQWRLGRDGKAFTFFKFRSMRRGADRALDRHLRSDAAAQAEWQVFQNLGADPRVTPTGRILRQLSLDELPQLWNVLKGDMSLVGPRPCMERQASLHADGWAHYCALRPGITGLWQVSGRNRLTYRQRVELDVEYVDRWSLALDLVILVRTFRAVLAGGG